MRGETFGDHGIRLSTHQKASHSCSSDKLYGKLLFKPTDAVLNFMILT